MPNVGTAPTSAYGKSKDRSQKGNLKMKSIYTSPRLGMIALDEYDILTASGGSTTEKETFSVNPDGSIDFPTIPFG